MLVRQSPRDGSRDFRSTLLGMKYGGVPCINSLNSIYQFQVSLRNGFGYLLIINAKTYFMRFTNLYVLFCFTYELNNKRFNFILIIVKNFFRTNHGCLHICFKCKDVWAKMHFRSLNRHSSLMHEKWWVLKRYIFNFYFLNLDNKCVIKCWKEFISVCINVFFLWLYKYHEYNLNVYKLFQTKHFIYNCKHQICT